MRRPIGEALAGLELEELEQGLVPLEALVLVKVIDEDGDPCWAVRTTDGLTDAEAMGALLGELDRRRAHYLASFETNGDDEAPA